MLDEFRVGREKAVKRLSTGQKTLFSIALALSHEADLLILDEPTAGLDALLRRAILDRLRKFAAEGERAVVVSSHITDGLAGIAEHINFLSEGRLVLQSEKDELLARWKRIHFKDGALPQDLVGQFADVRRQPFGSSGLVRDFPALRERLAAGIASGDPRRGLPREMKAPAHRILYTREASSSFSSWPSGIAGRSTSGSASSSVWRAGRSSALSARDRPEPRPRRGRRRGDRRPIRP